MRIKKFTNIPKNLEIFIKWIGSQADRYGFSAFIVGGFVRDILLKRKSLDFDVVVEGDGIDFAQRLAQLKQARLIRHRQFGTATVTMPEGLKVDFATARKEIYEQPAMLPKVTPGSIEDDLSRRDFSINAMAIKINKNDFGQLLDFFNGQDDLKNGGIRVLHNLSFIDDPTRILRAIRFEQRFNFKLESHTYFLMRQAVKDGLIDKVEPQRLWDELVLLLKEHRSKKYICRLNEICKLDFIHHNIKLNKVLSKTFDSVDEAINWFHNEFPHRRKIDTWIVYFILLIYKLKIKDVNHIIKKYNISKGDQKRIYSFLRLHKRIFKSLTKKKIKPSQIFLLLEPLSYEVIILLDAISPNDIIKKRIEDFLSCYNGVRLYIDGKDLISLGAKPGEHFKDILKKTLYAKIDGKLKTKSDELIFAKRLLGQQ